MLVLLSTLFFSCFVKGLDPTNETALCTLTFDSGTLSNYLYNETSNMEAGKEAGLLIHTYQCPGNSFPSEFTRCCPENFQSLCCSSDVISYNDDSSSLIWLPISITCLCIVIAVSVVVCCFWSRCPMYTTCKPRHFGEESVAYQTDEEKEALNGGVPEEKKGIKSYDLDGIKVKAIADV